MLSACQQHSEMACSILSNDLIFGEPVIPPPLAKQIPPTSPTCTGPIRTREPGSMFQSPRTSSEVPTLPSPLFLGFMAQWLT